MSPVPADPRIAAIWQLNEAVSMLRQALRTSPIERVLRDEIELALPEMQSALEAAAAADAVLTPPRDAELVRAAEEALRYLHPDEGCGYQRYRTTWDDLRAALNRYIARAAVVSPPPDIAIQQPEITPDTVVYRISLPAVGDDPPKTVFTLYADGRVDYSQLPRSRGASDAG